jgi:hypothetical protein
MAQEIVIDIEILIGFPYSVDVQFFDATRSLTPGV